jgi:hypothetical protein
MKHLWRREEGSVGLTLTWFMLFSVVLAIGLDSFLGIYIARQQGRSAADAAALATTREISRLLPDEVRAVAAERVETVVNDPAVADGLRELGESIRERQEACAQDPLCTPMTPDEIADMFRARRISLYQTSFARHYRGSLSRAMAERMADGTWSSAGAAELLDGLIPDDEDLGCLIMAVAAEHREEILARADEFAQANRARLDWSRSELSGPEGQLQIVVLRTIHPFGAEWIFQDGNLPALHVTDIAVLSGVGSRRPHYPKHC